MALNPPRHWDFLLLGWSLSFGTPGQISIGAYTRVLRSGRLLLLVGRLSAIEASKRRVVTPEGNERVTPIAGWSDFVLQVYVTETANCCSDLNNKRIRWVCVPI